MARIYGLRGELEQLRRHAGQCFERLTHFGERFEQARLCLALGDVYVERGDRLAPNWMDEAFKYYQRAETLFVDAGTRRTLTEASALPP